MTNVDIDDAILEKIDKVAGLRGVSRDDIISEALRDFLETIWKEKGSLKKRKGEPWNGAIPPSEYKPKEKE